MSTWTVVVLAGLAALAIRAVPVALLSSRPVPDWLERIGPLTAPVAFAALGASSVAGAASGGPAALLPLVAAVAVAGAVALRTRSTTWAVAARDGGGLGRGRAGGRCRLAAPLTRQPAPIRHGGAVALSDETTRHDRGATVRILFTSTAGLGHVHPLLPFVRAAKARGHEARLAITVEAQPAAHGFGVPLVPTAAPSPADAGAFWGRPGRAARPGHRRHRPLVRRTSASALREYLTSDPDPAGRYVRGGGRQRVGGPVVRRRRPPPPLASTEHYRVKAVEQTLEILDLLAGSPEPRVAGDRRADRPGDAERPQADPAPAGAGPRRDRIVDKRYRLGARRLAELTERALSGRSAWEAFRASVEGLRGPHGHAGSDRQARRCAGRVRRAGVGRLGRGRPRLPGPCHRARQGPPGRAPAAVAR